MFDVAARPWIQPDSATVEQVSEVVRRCPWGALRYRRADGIDEKPESATTVTPLAGGPLLLRGDLRIRRADADGEGVPVAETRMAACALRAFNAAPLLRVLLPGRSRLTVNT